jgi:hypothetical protein
MDLQNGMGMMILNTLSKIFDKLFFYYWKFYSTILRDDTPIITTVFALGATTSFIVTTFIDIIIELLKLKTLDLSTTLIISGIIIFTITLYFSKNGKKSEIIRVTKTKKSHLILSMSYFIFSILCMILGPVLVRYISEVW